MTADTVTETKSIADTPKDEQWYKIPSNSEHYIKWNPGQGMWQSMVFSSDGVPPKEHDWLEDGTEILGM